MKGKNTINFFFILQLCVFWLRCIDLVSFSKWVFLFNFHSIMVMKNWKDYRSANMPQILIYGSFYRFVRLFSLCDLVWKSSLLQYQICSTKQIFFTTFPSQVSKLRFRHHFEAFCCFSIASSPIFTGWFLAKSQFCQNKDLESDLDRFISQRQQW